MKLDPINQGYHWLLAHIRVSVIVQPAKTLHWGLPLSLGTSRYNPLLHATVVTPALKDLPQHESHELQTDKAQHFKARYCESKVKEKAKETYRQKKIMIKFRYNSVTRYIVREIILLRHLKIVHFVTNTLCAFRSQLQAASLIATMSNQ